MYLEYNDLLNGAWGETLSVLQREQPNAERAILDAMGEVKAYIFRLYDIDEEYKKTPQDKRCDFLVKIIRDIAIYNIYSIASPSMMNETKRLKYEDAISFLSRVQSQKAFIPDLAPLPDDKKDTGGTYGIHYGSNIRRDSHY